MSDLLIFVTTLTSTLGYSGIAVVMIVAAPELVMPAAGFLVARGELNFTGVLLAATFGAMVGQTAIYGLARGVGERRVRGFIRRYGSFALVSERDLGRTLALFDRFENTALFFSRVIPTVRSLISIPAGLKPMPLGRFTLFITLGTALWHVILLYLGTQLGRNWQVLADWLGTYEIIVGVLLGLAVLAFLAVRVRSKLAH